MFSFFKRDPNNAIDIFYSDAYVLAEMDVQSFGVFDPKRFLKIRDRLIRDNLMKYDDFIKPDMISNSLLELAHTKKHIEKLGDPISVARMLGLQSSHSWDNHIIDYFKTMSGGTVSGFMRALKNREIPVFNLGGGFHHAHAGKADGYCIINDTVIAIRNARHKYMNLKVIVIDLDYHQGNGNLILLKDDNLTYTFSISAIEWVDCKKDNNLELMVPIGCKDEQYLALLSDKLPQTLDDFRPDAAIYIAGNDPFVEDALCDLEISEKGMLDRDLMVYNMLKDRKISAFMVPAGGYGPSAWKPYYNFIKSVIMKA